MNDEEYRTLAEADEYWKPDPLAAAVLRERIIDAFIEPAHFSAARGVAEGRDMTLTNTLTSAFCEENGETEGRKMVEVLLRCFEKRSVRPFYEPDHDFIYWCYMDLPYWADSYMVVCIVPRLMVNIIDEPLEADFLKWILIAIDPYPDEESYPSIITDSEGKAGVNTFAVEGAKYHRAAVMERIELLTVEQLLVTADWFEIYRAEPSLSDVQESIVAVISLLRELAAKR